MKHFPSDIDHRIWTFETRDMLYHRLTMQFGPRREWESSQRPGRGLDEAYTEFLDNFAKMSGANSADAVQQQINFTMPINGEIRQLKRGQVGTMVLNLSAALKAGFIEISGFPFCISVGGRSAWEDKPEQE